MKYDGGAAFPVSPDSGFMDGAAGWRSLPALGGMSLRDYFAAAALQVIRHRLTINADAHDGGCTVDQIGDALCAGFVKTAYQIADAMLAEREK